MNYSFKRCDKNTYEAFRKIVSSAFDRTPSWFEENYGHIFFSPEKEKEYSPSISNNYILKKNGIEAGAIGVYPINLISGDAEYKVARVGCVSVLPEFRKQGIMTEMMNNVQEIIKEEKYDFSWLAGERIRYNRWGYELGGKTLKIKLDKKSFNLDSYNKKEYKTNEVKGKSIKDLEKMYSIYSNRTIRDEKIWMRQVKRKNLKWKYLPGKAYIAWDENRKGQILECAGKEKYVQSLIYSHFIDNKLDNVTIYFPCETNETSKSFLSCCQDYKIESCALWKKINKDIKEEIKYGREFFGNKERIISAYISMLDFA